MIRIQSDFAQRLKENNLAIVCNNSYSSTSCGFQNIATEITPDFKLSYKDRKLHQEQRFEQSIIYLTLRGSPF